MSEPYKPLFNRTYLKIIMWVSAIAILYLATLDSQEPDYLELNRAENLPVYWVENKADTTNLSVLLPTGSAISNSDKQLQTLLAQILESQLAAQVLPDSIRYRLSQAQDHLNLEFSLTSLDEQPDWQALFANLQQPIEPVLWQPVLEKLKARDYLQSHKTDQQLLNSFFTRLTGGDQQDPLMQLNSRYQVMLNNARFFVSGDDAEDLAEQLTEQPPRLVPSSVSMRQLNSHTQEQILPASNDSRFHLLLGSTIPPRNSDQFAAHKLAAHLLQDALAQTSERLSFDYRQLWASLQDGGYSALLLHADQPLDNLLTALRNRLTTEQADISRSQVIENWQMRMAEENNQLTALRQVALYQLPLDTLSKYSEQLRAVSSDQVVTLASASLDRDNQILITIDNRPSGN